jgi:WD40 repeat protein/predicted Ser/Thr protein kinase
MSDCPSSAILQELRDGRVSTSDKTPLEEHLRSCVNCQNRWQKNCDDLLFNEIRHALKASPATNPEAPASLQVEVAGYDVFGEIHRGGQGVVYKAVQRATKRIVALKVLLQGVHATVRQRHRFEREIDLAAQLRHPGIVTVFESGDAKGQPYFAMEFVDGRSLEQHLSNQSLTIGRRVELFSEICEAVAYAHRRGVIHRDLKPGNILIDADGKPHILDFGLAKSSSEQGESLTRSGEFLGTLAYAAPEQTTGDPNQIDTRTDVYAIGVIMYQALTGRLPYPADGSLAQTVANINQAVPKAPSSMESMIDRDLETIVLKALAKEQSRRYDSAVDLHRDILNYLRLFPIEARRDSAWYMVRMAVRRNRTAALAAATTLAALVVALIVSTYFWSQAVVDRNWAKKAGIDEHNARIAEESQRKNAEFQAYVANLAAAMGALDRHDVADARLRLDRAPAKYRDWEWGHLRSRLDQSEVTLAGHTEYLEAVAFDPQGALAVSASWDKTARVWDTSSGKCQRTFHAPASLRAAVFLPDGKTVALGCWNGTVILWDSSSGDVRRTFHGPGPSVWNVAVSAKHGLLAASFSEENLKGSAAKIWRISDATEVAQMQLPQRTTGLAFDEAGDRLFAACVNSLHVIDVRTGKPGAWSGPETITGPLAIDSMGKFLAAPAGDATIQVFDLATGKLHSAIRRNRLQLLALAFNSDGSMLAGAGRDKVIRLWRVQSQEEIAVLAGHEWAVSAVAFNHQGNELISGSWDNSVKLWRPGRLPPPMLRRHSKRVVGVAHDHRRAVLATGAIDTTVCLWDVSDKGRLLWQRSHDSAVQSVAIHPSGQSIASASWDKSVRIWAANDGKLLHTLTGHTDHVHSVAFSPDGVHLASGSRDNSLRIWDCKTGSLIQTLQGHTDHIHNVVYSPDSSLLASAGHQKIVVWNAKTFERVAEMRRTMLQDDFSLAFHPNSRWLAAGGDTQTVLVWEARTGDEIVRLRGHSDEIRTVAFSPSGERLVTASLDRIVRIWDTRNWTELGRVSPTDVRIESLAFSHDGHRLYMGRADGSIVILDDRVSPSAEKR